MIFESNINSNSLNHLLLAITANKIMRKENGNVFYLKQAFDNKIYTHYLRLIKDEALTYYPNMCTLIKTK